MSPRLDTHVVQVTNVAPVTQKEQLKTLFGFLGRIRDCKIFPPDGVDQQVAAKVCYVEYEDSTSAGVALHLTNIVFIDRALIVVPVMDGKIPDEKVAMQLTPQTVARMTPGQPAWPANVVSQLTGTGANQMVTTYDPRLNALGLPQYPPLPASLDASHVEEIRRTVYIGNLDPKTTGDSLISFFSQVGEVKYVCMAGEESGSSRSAYMEFTDQRSVATCLTYNGVNFNSRTITVSHSKTNINKPLTKMQEASRREVEEAMKKVKEAQSLISAAAGEKSRSRSRSRRRSRSRSRGYSRSRSRSRGRRSRSRGRRRRSRSRGRRSRSRSPRRPRRSRSPRRRRSRSRSGIVVIPAKERRRRSRSRSPKRRSRSRSPKRRSRTPPRAYSRRSRSRDRSKSPVKASRRRSPSRSPVRGRRRSNSPAPSKKRRSKSRSPRRSRSPAKRKKLRSRSRSGSRHKSKKEKKRSRSRDRKDKDKERKKKSGKDKDKDRIKDREEKAPAGKVTRDYDEEEKGFNSGSDRDTSPGPPLLKRADDDDDIDDRRRSPVDDRRDDMDTSD